MNRAIKTLAVVMLVITLAAAGAAVYGMLNLAPEVVGVVTTVTPAQQAQETFDSLRQAAAEGVFSGKVYGDVTGLEAEDCAFVTYTVRVKNAGFLPAEWIALEVQPVSYEGGQDVLVLDNGGANVLPAGAQGDIALTLMTTITQNQPPRAISLTCYSFGRKQTVAVDAQ